MKPLKPGEVVIDEFQMDDEQPINISFDQYKQYADYLNMKLDTAEIMTPETLLVCMGRGGMWLTASIAHHFKTQHIKYLAVSSTRGAGGVQVYGDDDGVVDYLREHAEVFSGVENILLIDDLIDTGATAMHVRKVLAGGKQYILGDIYVAVLVNRGQQIYGEGKGEGEGKQYFYGVQLPDKWIQFPWEEQ